MRFIAHNMRSTNLFIAKFFTIKIFLLSFLYKTKMNISAKGN